MTNRDGTLEAKSVVLLDAGGTLITLEHDRVREALPRGAPRVGDEALERAEAVARRWADDGVRRGLDARALWDGYFERLLAEAGLDASHRPAALEALWEANRRTGLWRRPVAGARAVLERLRDAGRRLAVVSNAEGQVAEDLDDAGFAGLFETVVDSSLVGVAKPDPRIFEIALERLGAAPGDALYVGDVPAFDVEGARAAGIVPVLLDPWEIHGSASATRIARLEELPALLGLA